MDAQGVSTLLAGLTDAEQAPIRDFWSRATADGAQPLPEAQHAQLLQLLQATVQHRAQALAQQLQHEQSALALDELRTRRQQLDYLRQEQERAWHGKQQVLAGAELFAGRAIDGAEGWWDRWGTPLLVGGGGFLGLKAVELVADSIRKIGGKK